MLKVYWLQEWMSCLLYFVIGLAILIGLSLLSNYLKTRTTSKFAQEFAWACDVATDCISQIMVDRLKAEGTFKTEEAHAAAREAAYEKAVELLSPEAREFLFKGKTEEDAKEYMFTLIEQKVREHNLKTQGG